jgi:hypothetical protein
MTERRPYPWVVPDLFRWFGLLGLSAGALCVAWWCSSGTAQVHSLVTWVNVGVVAVVVGGLGNVTWLLQGRRAVTARQRELAGAMAAARPAGAAASAYPDDDVRVSVPGTTRHHRPGCVAVAGKQVERATRSAHERAGRRPCGLCEQ